MIKQKTCTKEYPKEGHKYPKEGHKGNFLIRSRKGSQISFIISFLLFISFLIFFISILNPFEKIETGKSSLLKHLENEIIKNVTGDVEVISVKEKVGNGILCGDFVDNNFKAKTKNGIIKFYISNEFSNSDSCQDYSNEYELGLIRTQKYVFQSKILKLNKSYEDDYEYLKKYFGIPETNDFEVSLLNINKSSIIKINSKETPQTEVLADIIPVTYFNKTSEIENGYLKVVLW